MPNKIVMTMSGGACACLGEDDPLSPFRNSGAESASSMPSKPFFVAVHVGAGFHSEKNDDAYNLAMRRACRAAAAVLSQVVDALIN